MSKLSRVQQKIEQKKVDLWEDIPKNRLWAENIKKRDFSAFAREKEQKDKFWMIFSLITLSFMLGLFLYEVVY